MYLQYWYFQYCEYYNTGNTSIVNITILVIPVSRPAASYYPVQEIEIRSYVISQRTKNICCISTQHQEEKIQKRDVSRVIGIDFLLNGPMAPSTKFQWVIQKMNGPYHKPNGSFFTCISRFWKLCNRLSLYFSCQFSYTLYKTFYFHLSKARAKVFPKAVYIYDVRTFHFRFQ